MKRSLPVSTAPTGLGLVTIMDRDLGARFGAPYVRLAALAIDVDRIRVLAEEEGDDARWPFGWDVLLTEAALLGALPDDDDAALVDFLDAVCASVFERSGEGDVLGAQLVFSVFAAHRRGALPGAFRATFLHWKKGPGELLESVEALRQAGGVARFAAQCLETELDPPLAPTTREALERLRG